MKQLKTTDELIEHMERKGIQFNIVGKDEATEFLQTHNYYMKLASYRTNYKKYAAGENAGKYINLEFAYLRELSTIDMHLRYLIVRMALDIEHYLKVRLLHSIEENQQEDGYHLVREFVAKEAGQRVLGKIRQHKASDYCKDLIEKYDPDFPVWVFVELISFGELAHLCEFYRKLYGEQIADRILLNSVKDIRNASAHSNCLINHLMPETNRAHTSVVRRVKRIQSIGMVSRDKKLSNKILYDFTCLLFAYDETVTSESTKTRRYEELSTFFTGRMVRNRAWFSGNPTITSAYTFAKKILDNIARL